MYREIVYRDENFLQNIDYRRIAIPWYYRYRGQNFLIVSSRKVPGDTQSAPLLYKHESADVGNVPVCVMITSYNLTGNEVSFSKNVLVL